MTRTTTAAAPAPRNGRNGKVRTVTVDPATLAGADLSAPTLPDTLAILPESLAAALAAAQQEEDARRARAVKPAAERVALTPQEASAMAAAGWSAPRVDANLSAAPQPRSRQNACKGAAAYTVALQILTSGQPLKVTDLAALWIAAGNRPRALNGVIQQLANRSGRTIQQSGALITAG